MEAEFDVLIGAFGDCPEYTLRCVQSIIGEPDRPRSFGVHVGCNACGETTITALRSMYDRGLIDALIESRHNLNKDRMMRLLIERVDTRFFLWLDDDSHVKPGWDLEIEKLLKDGPTFDCAGHVFFHHRPPEYKRFLVKRPWWIGEEAYPSRDHRKRVWFPTGGLFLGRAAFFRRHNFPDRAMVKRQDDLLLGDMISQTKGTLIDFPSELMGLITISDGNRRGSGESSDGWLDVHPVTGE